MTQLTKQEIVEKTEEFKNEISVLVNNAKKTKQWIDMAIFCEPDLPAMEEKFDKQVRLAEDKVSEFRKFEKENPFDDAPMRIVK
tara:strand:+ start:30 stop:281 length:252 start_codon:yes stop_codon:yes gene_type:complete